MFAGLNPGQSYPLGATVCPGGVNFSLFSRDATAVQLLLFDSENDTKARQVLDLAPQNNRSYHYWHVFVPEISHGQVYGYRVSGPFRPERGQKFDFEKLLLDPYGRAVAVPERYDREVAKAPGDTIPTAMKNVVVDPRRYDWQGDAPLERPLGQTVIYEMHVRGFTRHPSSGVPPEERGTYAGLIRKIPYLADLGVTAVELMPVFQFDPWDAPEQLPNYWGYSPVCFFAPHLGYSASRTPLGAVDEFRDMVKALHRAGIEVILDVVFNHTAEGNEKGPIFCFKGLANDLYYILEGTRSRYANYSGCGNTLNANQPIVRRMIVDSLRYWVQEMHVDGFRFDLASILARDEKGRPLDNPPVLWDIETDPVLAGTKLIAEAWDAAGLYQVGSFLGHSWREWNGRFRDDVRSFIRGEEGMTQRLASRLLGSPDLYGHEEREPEQSVNFVTAHDGFTLNDLVSYNTKHNEANREENRDGTEDNRSWNCGVEGPTNDAAVEWLREKQIRNFFTINLVALGAPMILMGDEVRRTQWGNNNAYCQDNEISWFDWSLVEKHQGLLRFVQRLVNARVHIGLTYESEDLSLNQILSTSRIEWHGVKLFEPDWHTSSHSLAFTVQGPRSPFRFHVMLNAFWEPLEFELPPAGRPERHWRRWVDTALLPPHDITSILNAPEVQQKTYRLDSRSVVVLFTSTAIKHGKEGAKS